MHGEWSLFWVNCNTLSCCQINTIDINKDVSGLAPTVQKWSQNPPETDAASCPGYVIWSQSLDSRDQLMEPWYQGLTHTAIWLYCCLELGVNHDISSQIFLEIFLENINKNIKPNLSEKWACENTTAQYNLPKMTDVCLVFFI